MKYYIYISDAKVDMLFPQVPHDIKRKVALEFKMDLKLLSASRTTETETEDNRIARLETVVDFIREYGNVGSVDEPDEYIEGTLPMRWGLYDSPGDEVVYFGAETAKTVIGLGGSKHHVIGNMGTSLGFSASAAPFLLNALSKELNMPTVPIHPSLSQRPDAGEMPLRAVQLATRNMKGPQQNLEFLAKRLLYAAGDVPAIASFPPSHVAKQTQTLLGTPIYVAMAD